MTVVAQRVLARFANAADLAGLVRKYMAMLGLDTAPVVKVQNSIGAKALGTCRWAYGQPTSTITVQKVVTGDPMTLERILAHEMAHHAVFLENIQATKAIEQERGSGAAPYIRAYLQHLRREDDHGESWMRYVKTINARMGADFVTKTSDSTYVQNAETKPYYILIAMLPNGRYGWQIGVSLTARMKQAVELAMQRYGGKLMRTTDPRWENGPRIGTRNWATSADKQDDLRQLHSSS